MKRVLKPKFDEEDLGVNPFTQSFKIVTRAITIKSQFKVVKDRIKVPVELDMEYEPSCKIYTAPSKRLWLFKQKPRSQSLMLWIIYAIDYSKDYIWINKKRYMEESGTSLNTTKAAIEDLIKAGVITKTIIKDVYWINPKFFFKGDRVKKYPNNTIDYDLLSKDRKEELRENLDL